MKECPQCRHVLLNARNRTAESVAELLNNMKEGRIYSNTAQIEVTVTEPEEVKKKLTRYVVYRYANRLSST